MKEFKLGHTGDIGISKSKIFEMKKPKLEYLNNEPMIYKYVGQLEFYCYALEKNIERLEKELDKAFDVIVELNEHASNYISNKENWKEWCMKDE